MPRTLHDACQRAITLVSAITFLREPGNDVEIASILGGFVGPTARTISGLAGNTIPAWFVIADGQNMVIVIDGTSTWAQDAIIWENFIGGPLDSIQEPVAQVFLDAATTIVNAIAGAGIGFPPNVLVGGYSFGGAIANVLR